MRRSFSLFSAIAIAATSLVALSHSPVSASSAPTVVRSPNVSPSSIANYTTTRAVRLGKSNQMLVVGVDRSTNGSMFHLWKVNDDLTFDTTFGAVGMGSSFTTPTATNSQCVATNTPGNTCFFSESLTINENADRFATTISRQLRGSGSSSSTDQSIVTIAVGKISTGEILATTNVVNTFSGVTTLSDWAQYSPVTVAKNACETGTGTAIQGIPFASSFGTTFSMPIRSDGSVLISATCTYSNNPGGQTPPTSVTDFRTSVVTALGIQGTSLAVDNTFGTNGVAVLFNDVSLCGNSNPSFSFNSGIASNASTAMFVPYSTNTYSRSNVVPSFLQNQGVTSYSGCDGGITARTVRLTSLQANGVVKNTTVFTTGVDFFLNRWIIDPQGRWNTTVTPFIMGPQSAQTTLFIRLNPDGSPDTTIGNLGIKEMTMLPTTVSVNGTTIQMRYSLLGLATTATGILFTGFASASTAFAGCGGQTPPNTATTSYPFYLTLESGLLATFGTNGLGDGVAIEILGSDSCGLRLAQTPYINTKGQHVLFAETRAIGSQTAGLFAATWNATDGVTGGGEGLGAIAPAVAPEPSGRTDTKVYSRKLPTTAQVDTSLNVLTKKASTTQMLRTRTPKVCVALTQSVVLVETGTCRVDIVDRASKSTVRSLSTQVRTTDATVGTTVKGQDAVRFSRISTRLSANARTQVAEIATAAVEGKAKRVILIGHTALLTENTVSNNRIALQRAARVKAELQKLFKAAGVKVPISIVSIGSQAPITTKKTESRQTENRRVEIYLVP